MNYSEMYVVGSPASVVQSPITPSSSLLPSPGASATMVRKRTLEMAHQYASGSGEPGGPYLHDQHEPHHPVASTSRSSPLSSPHGIVLGIPIIPSFEFDPARSLAPSSSPYSISSSLASSSPMSPMSSLQTSRSSLSAYSDYHNGDLDVNSRSLDSEDEDGPEMDDEADENFVVSEPDTKRRRKAGGARGQDPSTPVRGDDKRGNGKDGLDVWPAEVEDVFHAALKIIPKLGRKKVMVNSKPCGRNELIADFILRKTGKVRSRKQVSSHIQVLKNMRKNDVEFMKLVSEPLDGEDTFAPEAALAFFGHPALGVQGGLGVAYTDGLLSPYTPTFLHRSLSCGSTPLPLHSPALSDSFPIHSAHPRSAPMSATSSLTNAMKDMHFPIPPPNERTPASCPIAPSAFCLWADDADSDAMHVFAKLDAQGGGGCGPVGTVFLQDLPLSDLRFPGLVAMNEHLPCQFLHVKLNLDVPSSSPIDATTAVATQLHTQLTLTSLQDLNLTAVTSIYSYGTQVLSLEEQLAPPTRLGPSSRGLPTSSASSSPASPLSPLTPGSDVGLGSNPLRHKFSYNAPFAADFWSIFLRGAFSTSTPVTASDPSSAIPAQLPSFTKTGAERSEFAMAISGLSVIQEFVVKSEEPIGAPLVEMDGGDVSPGSALGDVVLVVTYDFECKETLSMGAARVCYLKTRTPERKSSLMLPVPADAAAFFPLARTLPHGIVRPTPLPLPTASPGRPRPTHSPNKPSLSLLIPPPAAFLAPHPTAPGSSSPNTANGLVTPWPQVLHTPLLPPPVRLASENDRERERLEGIWKKNSGEWELGSPALLGAFHPLSAGVHEGFALQQQQQHQTQQQLYGIPYQYPPPPVHHSLPHYPKTAQALHELTSHALASPNAHALASPRHVQHTSMPRSESNSTIHGTPFVIHPSHGYLPKAEIEGGLYTGVIPDARPVRIQSERGREGEVQDYFTGLLGRSTKYVVGA